ncbi:MAG: M20 aminoacylase family protein [Pseudomonadota bacterium]
MPVLNRVAELYDEMVEWRRDFHAHPELSFDVFRTAEVVETKLKEFGCDEVVTGIGRTGVVGIIKGRKSSSGKCVGLRSDMDALPIPEQTGLPYASKTPGKMHACGHDGHMAMLLGAAKYLAETRNFDGQVALIFQPAEEDGGGGAKMVQDGMMERFGIQQVFGMHNAPDFPIGAFGIRPGPLLASTDEYTVTICGKGGHAARPHQSVDSMLIAAHIVASSQSVVARNLDPLDEMVVSTTSVQTESDASNVISETTMLKGTVRCFSEENRALARERLSAIFEHTAAALGGSVDVTWVRGYPPTLNDPDAAMFAADVADEISPGCQRNVPPVMGAEDFSYMLQARPGAMIMVGNGDSAECHHPAYDFADETMPAGASWWIRLTERAMPIEE